MELVPKQGSTAPKSSKRKTSEPASGLWVREQEPSWPAAAKKPEPSNGVRDPNDPEGESSEEDSDDEEDDSGSGEGSSMSEGSISDSYDSDTEWDEAKLEAANERKYWSR